MLSLRAMGRAANDMATKSAKKRRRKEKEKKFRLQPV
jgi:hypothetical protein